MNNYLIIIFVSIMLYIPYMAINKGELIDTIQVGYLVNIKVKNGMTVVETTKGTFVISGYLIAMKQSEVIIEKYSSGKMFLCVSGNSYCEKLL